MSELKAYTFSAMERVGLADYYLKSEADKVIAEKDAEIAELKAQKAQAEDDCAYWKMSEGNAANAMHETEEYAMQLYNEARHHKYKRCVAMAKLAVKDDYAPWNMKWHKRWLELAEKFKETK